MSSSDRRSFLVLLAAAPLAACGFAPAYAPGGAVATLQGRIAVQAPVTRNDFDLVARLETRLGRPEAALYDLTYTLVTRRAAGGISPSNTITRYTLNGVADWTLTDRRSGARVAGGTVRNFTSWSATGATIAGRTAEDAAQARLMQILADAIVTRLIATAGTLPPP
ncbi:MAG: hypothetical protein RIT14_2304 [Pseudomonadota bacterium]|jgi:LPS-assembly lipoprotein